MSETIITKRCTRCKQIKPLSEFYKDKSYKDGCQASCKTCRKIQGRKQGQTPKRKAYLKAYQGKWGKTEQGKMSILNAVKRYQIRHPARHKARQTVRQAVKEGRLPRLSSLQCSHCDKPAQDYHHPSYLPEHWLDVVPVCFDCHKTIHKQIKQL